MGVTVSGSFECSTGAAVCSSGTAASPKTASWRLTGAPHLPQNLAVIDMGLPQATQSMLLPVSFIQMHKFGTESIYLSQRGVLHIHA